MRTIRVTGKGNIKIKPDMTRLSISIEGSRKDYGEILKLSYEETEKLKALFVELGFSKEDLKTVSFDVHTKYESYKENDVFKDRFVGYGFEHRFKIEFESDNELLGKILYSLAHSDVYPQFWISYTVKDPESVKNELLGNAVKDSMDKASVLAKAAGVALGDIQNIDYSWGEIKLESRPMGDICLSKSVGHDSAPMYDLDIEPDDIDVSDTVTVIWEIA